MKKRLFTPGPTPIPETVMLKMAEPIIHHRNPEFNEILTRVNKNLKYLFQTEQPVLTLTCSGTGGVESTFVSLFSPGDMVIAVNGGKFGERWVKMPKAFGMNVAEIKTEWGKAPSAEQMLAALKAHPDAKAVYLVHSETSTGTATDVKAMAKLIRENSRALVCVDGITAVGAHELRFDEWGIDVCVTGSQKGLMIPPGLAFVALSQRAITSMETSKMPKFYFDLRKAVKSHADNDTPFTPAVSLIIGVDAALEMIRAEGIENVWKRHERLATALRAGVLGLGLKLFSDSPSYAVTPVWVPEGVAWKAFNKVLKGEKGITIAGGQDDYKDKIFRVSHLGYYDELDMIAFMGALEQTLAAVGYKFSLGAGLAAAQQSFLSVK
ncbi:MAG: alanine--glyoxylate aminotransferase family protein [Bacteroidetes bacterium]|nr:alanine--glyoxylate aminotransferase family protein [Bacteroidota bacterium]MCW5896375.1 alanine--glyoxylate aminotransferase family protein [Bacteroidota bacterium]